MKRRPAWLIGGMSIELGEVGIWRHPSGLTPEVVAEVEALGYGAIWVGGSPPGDLGAVERLLDTTDHIAVATGIVNVWKDDAATVAASWHRITARHPGRFLLGIGIGHPEATPSSSATWTSSMTSRSRPENGCWPPWARRC